MRKIIFIILVSTVFILFSANIFAGTSMIIKDNKCIKTFPDLADHSFREKTEAKAQPSENQVSPAIWPFSKNEENGSSQIKHKSSRKAFFLSLLVPGLGEAYVGSKRSFIFLGIEALSWWMYLSNTGEGNDLEDEYEQFADKYWHYYDTEDSDGNPLEYNYWGWLQEEYGITDLEPTDYEAINKLIEKKTGSGGFASVHELPSTKTQQYYEMIGKYGQFVFGWEDIDDNQLNPSLADNGYKEENQNINSPLRSKYMDMRADSNDKLRAGQRGIHIMLINRILSAIDAGRLAYKHNKKLESDLSMVRVRLVQKHIIDHKVPMLMFTKNF